MSDKVDYRAEFIMATYRLAKSNPAVWSDFVAAYTMWSVDEIERGLSAPTSEMQVIMGMGRQLKQLRSDFINIDGLAQKIQEAINLKARRG